MGIKLEVGKKYKLRNGLIARCICTDRLDKSTLSRTCILLTINDGAAQEGFTTCSGAGLVHGDDRKSDYDVISEYKEPRTLYALYNTNSGEFSGAHTDKKAPESVKTTYPYYNIIEFIEKVD